MFSARQVPVPPAARAHRTLSRVNYEDAFLVDVPSVQERTGESWARAVLEEAPIGVRAGLLSGWSTLGLRLNFGRSAGFVLGWTVRLSSPEFVLLGADSRIGMPAELLFMRREGALLFATAVQRENPLTRALWAGVEPVHRLIVRHILDQAARRHRQ